MKNKILGLLNNKILILMVWIGIITIFFAYNYFDLQLMDYVGVCSFKSITGLLCPGCGGTRAVHFLLKGNIVKSLAHHILPLLLFLYLVLLLVEHSIHLFIGLRTRIFIPKRWMLGVLAAIVLVYAAVRNIFV
ncbi:MAG: DUF2752 domain-containing protein [Bacillota bacterium]|nr:DUF2752 domain-containing protein [Bacillota bacterium]